MRLGEPGVQEWCVKNAAIDHAQDAAREMLARVGERSTPIRVAVLGVLAQSAAAMDAADVIAALKAGKPVGKLAKTGGQPSGKAGGKSIRVDRVTVYRTLATLVDCGLAHKIDAGDRVFRYSLTDHSRCDEQQHRHDHPHIVCDACGTVECLTDAEVIIKTEAGKPSVSQRFRVRAQEVTLRGTCGKCETTGSPTGATGGTAGGSTGTRGR